MTPPSFTLPGGAAAALLVFAALASVMLVARKVGPAAVSGPEESWTLAVGGLIVTIALGMLVFSRLELIPGRGSIGAHTGAAVLRLSRMALPAAAMVLWTAVLWVGAGVARRRRFSLIALGGLAGVGFGASAVRGVYRVQPDWGIPPNDPFGPIPIAQAGSMVRGFDTTLLAQAGFSAVCVLVGVYS